MEQKFMRFQKKIFLEQKSYPLDYIMNLPREHRNKSLSGSKQQLAWRLRNIQKNIVMRRIMEIKALKAKPGLKEAIEMTLAERQKRDENIKKRLKKRIMELYEKELGHTLNEDDKQFTKIILQIDRMYKCMSSKS